MKVYIPSYNRHNTIMRQTIHALGGLDYRVVLHDGIQAGKYIDAGVPEARIIVSDTPPGMFGAWHQRKFITEEVMELDEWAFLTDDDVTRYTAIPDPFRHASYLNTADGRSTYWRNLFDTPVAGSELLELLEEQRDRAESYGARCVGWTQNRNPFFRKTRWRKFGRLPGWATLWKRKADFRWGTPNHFEDEWMAARTYLLDGLCLNDVFAFADSGWNQPGGYGEQTPERIAYQEAGRRQIEEEYPGLYKRRKGVILVNLHDSKAVEKWRLMMHRTGNDLR